MSETLESRVKRRATEREEQFQKLRAKLDAASDDEQQKWTEILQLPFAQLVEQLHHGAYSCTETLHAYQRQALTADARTNCVTQFLDDAERRAAELDLQYAGVNVKPPLFGLPFSVKECLALSGLDATSGLVQRLESPHAETAVGVRLLMEAGAVPFVRSNVPQAMMTFCCSNPIYGLTTHPLDEERTPGGSSGGEGALVSMNATVFGLGSDGGGSVRIPASFCGTFGFKSRPPSDAVDDVSEEAPDELHDTVIQLPGGSVPPKKHSRFQVHSAGPTPATNGSSNANGTGRAVHFSFGDEQSANGSTAAQRSRPLEGVVAIIDITSKGYSGRLKAIFSRQANAAFGSVLQHLGAKVAGRFSKRVTHLVHEGGRDSYLRKARDLRLSVVNILWVEECRMKKKRIDENQERFRVSYDLLDWNDEHSVVKPKRLRRRRRYQKEELVGPLDEEMRDTSHIDVVAYDEIDSGRDVEYANSIECDEHSLAPEFGTNDGETGSDSATTSVAEPGTALSRARDKKDGDC